MEMTEKTEVVTKRHNPLTFYLRTLLYMFMALLMRLVAFAPLAALWVFPESSWLRWLWVLCPVLLIFFILPQRFSFAQALVQKPRERAFSFDKATSLRPYGRKLGEALVHALNILKWGIPLWLALGACVYFYLKTDAITLMTSLSNLGASVVAVGIAVANFFIGIFGGTALVPNGGIMEGAYTVLAVLGVLLLVLMLGMVRNSAFRYIWAQATESGLKPRAQARRRLAGRRWTQLGVAVLNLVLWLPALFVAFTTLKGVLSGLSDALFNYVATRQLNLPELSNALYPLLFAFLVCYMPLLPVRRIMTAFFATKALRRPQVDDVSVADSAAAQVVPEPTLPPVTDAPLFVPASEPVAAAAEPEPDEEPDATATEPVPVPVYMPAAQPNEPQASETPAVEEAWKPEEQAAPVTAAAPVFTPEPETLRETVFAPEPLADGSAVPEPEPAPVAPVFMQEPDAPDGSVHMADPEEPAFSFAPSPEPVEEPIAEPVPETAALYGMELHAEEDAYATPKVTSIFDADEPAAPEAPVEDAGGEEL